MVDEIFPIRIVVRVKWLKTVAVVLLVGVWLPASSHALLQQVGFIHQVHTHDDQDGDSDGPHKHDANNHDAADGFCHVAPTHVQVPQMELSGSPSLLASVSLALMLAAAGEASLVLPNGPDPPGVAPPELSHAWQFSFRASLLPRAPSLIS